MLYFDGVIIVEGKGDVSFLSSFINTEYVVLNGYDMPKDTVNYLKNIKDREILVLTDPDEAGIKIEENLSKTGLVYEYIKVDITKCNKNGKHGIAECEKDEILRVLNKKLTENNPFHEHLTVKEYSELGLADDKNRRNFVSNSLCMGVCNSKTLFKRLNFNKVTKEDILKLWK